MKLKKKEDQSVNSSVLLRRGNKISIFLILLFVSLILKHLAGCTFTSVWANFFEFFIELIEWIQSNVSNKSMLQISFFLKIIIGRKSEGISASQLQKHYSDRAL